MLFQKVTISYYQFRGEIRNPDSFNYLNNHFVFTFHFTPFQIQINVELMSITNCVALFNIKMLNHFSHATRVAIPILHFIVFDWSFEINFQNKIEKILKESRHVSYKKIRNGYFTTCHGVQ